MKKLFYCGCLLLGTLHLAGAPAPAPAPLRALDVSELYAEAEAEHLYRFIGTPQHAYSGRLTDYEGNLVAPVTGETDSEGILKLSMPLPVGFYQFEWDVAEQPPIGVGVFAPQPSERDPFFCMDGALAWLVGNHYPDGTRLQLVDALGKIGVAMGREGFLWSKVEPAQGEWDWSGEVGYQQTWQRYRDAGMEVLNYSHTAPEWLEKASSHDRAYPVNLLQSDLSQQTIMRENAAWQQAMETWNEPEGIHLNADQYTMMVKVLSHAAGRSNPQLKIGGGAYGDNCWHLTDGNVENGMLEAVDFLSFHTYCEAPSLVNVLGRFRQHVAEKGHAGMPLWITECGRPWTNGEFPNAAEDSRSAVDIAQKAAIAKACGAERYFPFVFPWYPEGNYNFGMVGHNAAPLRSAVVYGNTIRQLAHHRYLGELSPLPEGVQSAYAFAAPNDQEAVVVFFRGNRSEPGASFATDLAFTHWYGADGRELRDSTPQAIPIADGMTFGHIRQEALQPHLNTDTPAMHQARLAAQGRKAPRNASGVVVQYLPEWSQVQFDWRAYFVADATRPLPLRLRFNNLDDAPVDLHATMKLSGDSSQERDLGAFTVAPRAFVEVDLEADFLPIRRADGEFQVEVLTRCDGGEKVLPLSLRFRSTPDMERMLATFARREPLDLHDSERWDTAHVSPTGKPKVTVTTGAQTITAISANFDGGFFWYYPFFSLRENESPAGYDGIVFFARLMANASVQMILQEGDSRVHYLSAALGVKADGEWHLVYVPFRSLNLNPANEADDNGRLDLDQVRKIALGFFSDGSINKLEIGQAFWVKE